MTHGCIFVYGQDFPKGIYLNTTHSGYLIPEVVVKVPALVRKQRHYIKNATDAKSALRCDGTLTDWLTYPSCVAAMLIAAFPCLLAPERKPKTVKCYHHYRLYINGSTWKLVHPKDEDGEQKVETFDVYDMFVNSFRKKKKVK